MSVNLMCGNSHSKPSKMANRKTQQSQMSLNHPNTEGRVKSSVKEKADLDPKTERVLTARGYVVEHKISEGAFGKVYTARDTKKNIPAAVKVMDLNVVSAKFKEKFLPREITMLATLRHPNIINIFDIFKSQRKIYIFMELGEFDLYSCLVN